MANQIILKRSSTPSKVPTTAQLALGELAINTYDGRIYVKKDNGVASVVEIGGVTSVNTQTGDVVLSTTDVAEGTNQYFTTARARSALSAGTGISYSAGTGIITTTQNLTSAGSPTFAGLTLTGSMGITGNIVPSSDITYDLGSPTAQWKDIYVGPGSLYVNGSKVLQDDTGTITFSADVDQNIRVKTTGNGILQLGSSTTTLQIDSTMQMTAGKRITSSDGVKVQFGDDVEMNSNKVIGLGAPSAATDAATKGYVDSAIGAVSTSSITQGNSNIAVVDTGTGTVTVTVDGTTALTVDASGVVVAGNFTVSGTTTSVNSNTISLADNIVTLNSDATGAPTQNAGIEVERGDEANVQIRWNEGTNKWTFTNDGAVYLPMAVSTDDLAEGSTSQYFSQTRARTSVSASSGAGISYNSSTGVFNLSGIPNSSLSNSSVSVNGSLVSLGGSISIDTDAVAEGANKYFSNTLARGAVSAGTGISYNSTSGVITNTITQYTDALAVSANASAIATAKTAAEATAASDATSKVAAEATARDSAIAAAVALKDNTDELVEGTSQVFFTVARARNAISVSGSLAYNSTTGVISYTTPSTTGVVEGTNLYFTDARAVSANTTAISTAVAAEATLARAAEATLQTNINAKLASSSYTAADVLAKLLTVDGVGSSIDADLLDGQQGSYYASAASVTSAIAGLTNFHSTFQSVTSGQAATNVSAGVAFTFADLASAKHYNVYLNRMLLRPTEFSVSGSTLTIVAGMLSTDDEIEVTGLKSA